MVFLSEIVIYAAIKKRFATQYCKWYYEKRRKPWFSNFKYNPAIKTRTWINRAKANNYSFASSLLKMLCYWLLVIDSPSCYFRCPEELSCVKLQFFVSYSMKISIACQNNISQTQNSFNTCIFNTKPMQHQQIQIQNR